MQLSTPTHKITFLPDEKSVEVKPDKTLLDAARQVGVYVNSLCGGDGICGRCRVILCDGQIEETPHSLLTREEVQRSYVLACKSCPRSDLVVEVPIESRLEGGQIVKDADAGRFKGLRRAPHDAVPYSYDPLIQKMYLDMTAPSIADPLADLQRLYREIRRHSNTSIMQMGLAQTRRIAKMLRDNQWRVTVTVGQRGGTAEVTEVEGGDTSERCYAVAVDIGTTTVVAHLVNLRTGGTCGAEAMYNPQIKFGEDPDKGVLIVDTDDPTDPTFVPIKATRLIDLHEVPDDWSEAQQGFVKLHAMPTSTAPLPLHVELAAEVPSRALPQSARRVGGLFDGLESALLHAGLPEDYLPMALKMSEKAAKQLGIQVTLTDKSEDEDE